MIYLDSAATSLQKPLSVGKAVHRAMYTAASTGRGAHKPAMLASEIVYNCREELAWLFNVSEPDNVVFTMNATHALNIAINSLVNSGTRVLISGYEHNSVTRPLYARGAQVIVARAPLFEPEAMVDSFRKTIDSADVVIFTHVSNVFGYILPIERLAALCRERGKPFIIDAAQSAGVLPIDFAALGADFIAMPGHKGLLGPQGTGVLLCGSEGKPLMQGGSGSNSALQEMPPFLPDRLEAGTLNVCGIAGLLEGVRYVKRRGISDIFAHEVALIRRLRHKLAAYQNILQFADETGDNQSGVLSVIIRDKDSSDAAAYLGDRGICVRSGLHCAPEAHRTAGTLNSGTVRLSVSPFTTQREIDTAAQALGKFAAIH